MRVLQLRLAAIALAGGIALSGCAYDDYGYGYGGYGGYYGYGYSPYGYGYPYGDYYGYGGYSPFGWYGDSYYPGVGIYVYDRSRTRRVWNDDQRHYWSGHRDQWQGRTGTTTTRENWSGFSRNGSGMTTGTHSWRGHRG